MEVIKIVLIVLVVVCFSIVYPNTSSARLIRQETQQPRTVLGFTIPADEKVLYTEEEFHNVVLTNEAVYFSRKKGGFRKNIRIPYDPVYFSRKKGGYRKNIRIPYAEIRGIRIDYMYGHSMVRNVNYTDVCLLVNGGELILFLKMKGKGGYFPYPDKKIINIIREQAIKCHQQKVPPANTQQIKEQLFERLQGVQPTVGRTLIPRALLYNNEVLEIAEGVLGEIHIGVVKGTGRQSNIRSPHWIGTRRGRGGSPVFLFPNWIFRPYSGREPSLNRDSVVLINKNDIIFLEQEVTYKYHSGSSGSGGGMYATGGTYSSGTSGSSGWWPESFELRIYTPEGQISQLTINSILDRPIKDGHSLRLFDAYFAAEHLVQTLITDTDSN